MPDEDFSGLQQFHSIDETGEAEKFQRFLELVERRPDVIERRRRSYELLGLEQGSRVADVGSGLGTSTLELAELVGPDGRALGFDGSEAMVAEARRRAAAAGVEPQFEVADVTALPLRDGELDGYRAERVYQHLADPRAALVEAYRVLAPGGRIVLVDQDWDAFVVDSDDVETTRAILFGFSDSIVNGWMGRRYHALLVEAGFADVVVLAEAVPTTDFEFGGTFLEAVVQPAVENGTIPEQDAYAWLEDQRRRADEGRFFAAMTHFIGTARRPARA